MAALTRMYHILESIQYGVLYMVAAFIGGVGLDFSFPHYDPKKPVAEIRSEVMYQCIALVVTVLVVRSLVKSIPFLFPVPKGLNFVPYKTAEFNGEMMMGFVFLGCQLNLIQKLDFLAGRLYNWLFDEERKVGFTKQSVLR
jgi:hypothetical protein